MNNGKFIEKIGEKYTQIGKKNETNIGLNAVSFCNELNDLATDEGVTTNYVSETKNL